MPRLSDETRRERLHRTMFFCGLRGKGDHSEEEIARILDFRDALGSHSVAAMYEELESWGLPAWLVDPRGSGERASEGVTGPLVEKERKARGSGDAVELPPAGRAADLFRADLERLAYFLDRLPKLREHLQAERFVSSIWVGEDWEYLLKEDHLKVRDDGSVSDERWIELCEIHGEDPNEDEIRVRMQPFVPQGAAPLPWEGLIPLIAVHALLHEPKGRPGDRPIVGAVGNLLELLHPEPGSVDREDLYKYRGIVDELRTSAEKLVRLLRGVEVRSGRGPGTVSELDHWVAVSLIPPLVEEGCTDEQIHARITRKDTSLRRRYTVEDITRLRKLRLPTLET